jgi:hypothetical protein
MVRSRAARGSAATALCVGLLAGGASAATAKAAPLTCDGLEATIVGTQGRDVIQGTEGPDVIVGLDKPDRISGNGGDDVICGGNGPDTLFGGDGNDQLFGERGRGSFEGDPEGDNLDGGSGDDHIDGGRGGGHDDLFFGSATGGVTVDLLAGTSSGPGVGTDTITKILHVFTTRFDDTIRNASLADAGEGDDFITGERPEFTYLAIDAGPGDDRIIATSGTYTGGPGNDVMRAVGDTRLNGDEGDDTLLGRVTSTCPVATATTSSGHGVATTRPLAAWATTT